MYRREWRHGGLENHDEPISIEDPKQRLIVALMQKKVAEVLQTERFNNQFQIGMLSSFESFLQSVETVRRRDADEPVFDGDEQRRGLKDDRERDGIDTKAIGEVVCSYRKVFGNALPHPKLDTTAATLSGAFATGERRSCSCAASRPWTSWRRSSTRASIPGSGRGWRRGYPICTKRSPP